MSSHYDPNQPRVPAGHQDGGKWTGGAFGDRNILHSPFSDHGRLLDAEHVRRYGDQRERDVRLALLETQKPPIRQLPSSPSPRVVVSPKFMFPRLPIPYIGAAISLFSLLSQFNDDEQQAIIAFRSREFTRPGEGPFDLEGVRVLTSEKEVEDICGEGFKKVRDLVNEAYDKVKSERKNLPPDLLGTAVHTRTKQGIDDLKNQKIKGMENVDAELTYEKIPPSDRSQPEKHGAKGSIRMDVRNKVNEETVCVDEIKTGKRELLRL